MRRVHRRDEERHVRLHPEGAGGAHHRELGGEPRLELPRHVRLDGGEDQVHAPGRRAGILEPHRGHLGGDGLGEEPGAGHRLVVALAGVARGGSDGADLEPGVIAERRDELLTGDAGGTHEQGAKLGHGSILPFLDRYSGRALQTRGRSGAIAKW